MWSSLIFLKILNQTEKGSNLTSYFYPIFSSLKYFSQLSYFYLNYAKRFIWVYWEMHSNFWKSASPAHWIWCLDIQTVSFFGLSWPDEIIFPLKTLFIGWVFWFQATLPKGLVHAISGFRDWLWSGLMESLFLMFFGYSCDICPIFIFILRSTFESGWSCFLPKWEIYYFSTTGIFSWFFHLDLFRLSLS